MQNSLFIKIKEILPTQAKEDFILGHYLIDLFSKDNSIKESEDIKNLYYSAFVFIGLDFYKDNIDYPKYYIHQHIYNYLNEFGKINIYNLNRFMKLMENIKFNIRTKEYNLISLNPIFDIMSIYQTRNLDRTVLLILILLNYKNYVSYSDSIEKERYQYFKEIINLYTNNSEVKLKINCFLKINGLTDCFCF